MLVYEYVCVLTHTHLPTERQNEGMGFPGFGVTDDCEHWSCGEHEALLMAKAVSGPHVDVLIGAYVFNSLGSGFAHNYFCKVTEMKIL